MHGPEGLVSSVGKADRPSAEGIHEGFHTTWQDLLILFPPVDHDAQHFEETNRIQWTKPSRTNAQSTECVQVFICPCRNALAHSSMKAHIFVLIDVLLPNSLDLLYLLFLPGVLQRGSQVLNEGLPIL